MAYNFKNALVRKPCKSISNALSSIGEKPDFEKVIAEHNDYKMQLERSDIKIITLKNINLGDEITVDYTEHNWIKIDE